MINLETKVSLQLKTSNMKICKSEGCNNFVFSHHFCKRHQSERTDDKAINLKNVIVKRTIIPRTPIKAKFKQANGQLTCFKELWLERPHVSELSGNPIMFDVQCFHHILTKQAYPKFLLFKPNIIFLTRSEHRMIHDYSFEDLIKKDSRWTLVESRYQLLKEMYNHE